MNKIAAQKLAEARRLKGLSQVDMAAILAEKLEDSYSVRMYQNLEAGKFPKLKKAVAIALDEVLGTNLAEILYSGETARTKILHEIKEKEQSTAPSSQYIRMKAEDRINELLRDKEILQKSIQLSLNALLEGQRDIKAMLRTNQQNIDDLLADNGRELEEVRVSTGKRNAANLGLALKMDTSDLESTSSHLKRT